MITLLLAHPTITKAAVSLIACRKVASKAFLHADMNIECYTSEYNAWLALALPMLVMYSVGIPLTYFLILRRHVSKDTLEANRDIYGYLTSGYNDDRYWFELWNTVEEGHVYNVFPYLRTARSPHADVDCVVASTAVPLFFMYTSPYTVDYLNEFHLQT